MQCNMKTSEQLTLPFGETVSTFSPADSRAKMRVLPNRTEPDSSACRGNARGCILKCSGQYGKSSRGMLLRKTSPTLEKSMTGVISPSSLRVWPGWGIMQNGGIQVRQKSVPRTAGRGVTWLLNPVASDYMRANLSSPMYARRQHRSAGGLPEQLFKLGFRGILNYRFVLMIMGFPTDWLDVGRP